MLHGHDEFMVVRMESNGLVNDKEYFDSLKRNENIILYGAGSKGVQTCELLLEKGITPRYFVDSDKKKWGTKVCGIEVVSYEQVKKLGNYCILITTVYKTAVSIQKNLEKIGEKNQVYLCANPFKSETIFLKMENIKPDKLECTYSKLADQESRNLFLDFLNWKMTGDAHFTAKYTRGNWLEFFASEEIPQETDYTYFDIGAYTGDSIIRFLAFCGGQFDRIIAFEPDSVNFDRLCSLVENSRLPESKIEIENIGLWSESKELEFFSADDMGAYESSNFYCDTNNIISSERKKCRKEKAKSFQSVKKLDDLSYDVNGHVLMKIDTLGAELEVLRGGERFIKKVHPIIIMEIGTRYNCMFETIPYIYGIDKKYRFYLRQLEVFNNSRTILIAK